MAMPLSEINDVISASCDSVRATAPLVHCITNYVTVEGCANAVLAVGGSPIMSDEPADVEDITSICDALVINIGTLNQRSIESMKVAGAKAAELGRPIVLDPVGAGVPASYRGCGVASRDPSGRLGAPRQYERGEGPCGRGECHEEGQCRIPRTSSANPTSKRPLGLRRNSPSVPGASSPSPGLSISWRMRTVRSPFATVRLFGPNHRLRMHAFGAFRRIYRPPRGRCSRCGLGGCRPYGRRRTARCREARAHAGRNGQFTATYLMDELSLLDGVTLARDAAAFEVA